MIDLFNIEKQIGRRIRKFLLHMATEQNFDAVEAKLVINVRDHRAIIHLYNGSKHCQTLNPQSIADFFGKDFDQSKTEAVARYLKGLSDVHAIDVHSTNVVIFDRKGELGSFLFEGGRFIGKLPLLDIINIL